MFFFNLKINVFNIYVVCDIVLYLLPLLVMTEDILTRATTAAVTTAAGNNHTRLTSSRTQLKE